MTRKARALYNWKARVCRARRLTKEGESNATNPDGLYTERVDVTQEGSGVRADWHEPDEQGVTAVAKGTVFDNAGFSPPERSIIIKQNGKSVAEVNLAILFAWATGYNDKHLERGKR